MFCFQSLFTSHQMSYLYLNTTWNEQEILCLNWTFFSRQLRPEYLLCQKLNYRKVKQAPDLVVSENEEIYPPGNRHSCFQDPRAPLIRLVTAVCTLASEPDYTNSRWDSPRESNSLEHSSCHLCTCSQNFYHFIPKNPDRLVNNKLLRFIFFPFANGNSDKKSDGVG